MENRNEPPSLEYEQITRNLQCLMGFSCDVLAPTNGGARVHIAAIEQKDMAAEFRTCIAKGVDGLTIAVRLMLNDPELTSSDALEFLSRAQSQFYSTQNPLWAWMCINIFGQAGLPPPAWVWFYLLQAADDIACGVKESKKEIGERKDYLLKALLLHLPSGRRECLREFAEGLRTFQLALRVRNTMGGRIGLMKACQALARRRPTAEQKSKNFREATNDAYRAYHEWFGPPHGVTLEFIARDFGSIRHRPSLEQRLKPASSQEEFMEEIVRQLSETQRQAMLKATNKWRNKLAAMAQENKT